MANAWGTSWGVSWGVSWGSNAPPVPPILTGGHFGFDEKKRGKRWKKEREAEEERRQILRVALFGLPVEVREEITAQPEQAIERAAVTLVDYQVMLNEIEVLARRINQIGVERQNAQDDEDIVELIAMGIL